MRWEEASAYFVSRLSQTQEIVKRFSALSALPQAQITGNRQEQVDTAWEPLRKQLHRLRQGEFRIAVVGLEKAGKSTFVNAWLDYELLPSDSERCTFTTTRIESVLNTSDQRVEVTAKTKEEFDNLLLDLEQRAKREGDEGMRARADLETIENNRDKLGSLIGQDIEPIQYTRFDEVGDQLKKYVADKRFAHAIKEVRIFTSELARAEGVVFFDVPGLNSGLAKHIEESRQMLADCDAVICIKRARDPSLKAGEQKLVDFIREGEVESIGIDNKLFVFLGQADLFQSKKRLEKDVQKAKRNWHTKGGLRADKIVAGTAGGHLVLTGQASEATREAVGTADTVRQKMVDVFGVNEDSDHNAFVRAAGVQQIRERIMNYIETERVEVLKRRCNSGIDEIQSVAFDEYHRLRKQFPSDPKEARRRAEKQRTIQFSEWWEEQWVSIKSAVTSYYENNIEETDEDSSITRLKKRYDELVDDRIGNLKILDEDIREQRLASYAARGPVSPIKMNVDFRTELYDEIFEAFENIADQLSMELLEEAKQLVGRFSELLWESEDVQLRLLQSRERYRKDLKIGLRTLFLRFARPAGEALIPAPKGSPMREKRIHQLGSDVDLLDGFYDGDRREFRRLRKYAKYGVQLLEDPLVRKAIYGIAPPAEIAVELADKLAEGEEPKVTKADTKEEIIAEVEADVDALKHYLKHGVFSAAGFEAYRLQELNRLRQRFIKKEPVWRGVARNSWQEKNPQLLADLPDHLREEEFDLEINQRLKQLGVAIEQFDAPTEGHGAKREEVPSPA